MIVEYIRYHAQEQADALLAAYQAAAVYLARAPECLRYEIGRGAEDPSSVVVRIEWASQDAHEIGFRRGPHFPPFLVLVRPFLGLVSEMKHYHPVHSGLGAQP